MLRWTPNEIKTPNLHYSIPVVASRDTEKSEERHSEVSEVGVLAQSFAGMSRRAFCAYKQLNVKLLMNNDLATVIGSRQPCKTRDKCPR